MIQVRGFYMILLPCSALYPIYPISRWKMYCVVAHICSNTLLVCLQEPQYRAAFQRLSEGATVLSRQVLQDIVQAGMGPYGNKAGLIGRIEIYLCFNALLFWQVPINNIRRELRGSTKTIQSQSSSQRWLYSNWWFENHCEGPWKKCWINVSFWWLQLSVFSLNFSPCRVTPLKGSVLVDENTAMVETEWKLVLEEI